MRVLNSLALALSLAISFISPSFGHAHQARRHHVHRQGDLARRATGEVDLYKRFDGARFTFYAVGLGACGQTNQPSDFIVALNSAQFNGGQYCFQMISITANGKTTQAQIMDECPGCPMGGLDFSQGLFEFFADVSVGVLSGSWNFDSGGSSPAPSPSPAPAPAPAPSPSPPPPPPPPSSTTPAVVIPTTTWLPSPTTTTLQPPPTTSSSAPLTTSAPSSSPTPSTISPNTSSLVPTQTTTIAVAESSGAVSGGAVNSSAILDVNRAAVNTGGFLSSCKHLQ